MPAIGTRLRIDGRISIAESELDESFVRASGPGGQNVNKVSTAVQLRFDVARSPSLPEEIKRRLRGLAGRRLTEAGILVISAQRFRSQDRNREDARDVLIDLVRRAAVVPRQRRPTRPPLSSRVNRLETKRNRAETKRQRGGINPQD